MKQALLATLAAAAIFGSPPGFSANVVERISSQGIYLDPGASARYLEMIHDHLRDMGIDPEMSGFKVRATQVTLVLCTPGNGNLCYKMNQQTVMMCPTSIPVQQPDGSYQDVAVECNPDKPDAEGNCECKVKGT
ncbi:MAG: hypothetical protein WAW42_11870 [Candidatus Competibacteraceae bacterium]